MKISARKALNKVASAVVVTATGIQLGKLLDGSADVEATGSLVARLMTTSIAMPIMFATDDSASPLVKKSAYLASGMLAGMAIGLIVLETKTTTVYEWHGTPIVVGGEATM